MKEKILNFGQMVEDYYRNIGKNGVFHFLHIVVNYTYLDLHHQYIDGNDDWKLKERKEKIKTSDVVFIPVIVDKDYYDKNYKGKIYNYDLNPIIIEDLIDIGDSDNFSFSEVREKISSVIPKQCEEISEKELIAIANSNGYENLEIDIYDEAQGKAPVFYAGPEWHYDVYGVKKIKDIGSK